MNMLCMGWKAMNNCGINYGRNQSVVAPTGVSGAACPSAMWWYLGAALVIGMAVSKK